MILCELKDGILEQAHRGEELGEIPNAELNIKGLGDIRLCENVLRRADCRECASLLDEEVAIDRAEILQDGECVLTDLHGVFLSGL